LNIRIEHEIIGENSFLFPHYFAGHTLGLALGGYCFYSTIIFNPIFLSVGTTEKDSTFETFYWWFTGLEYSRCKLNTLCSTAQSNFSETQ